ncbi:MAG: hypothetical protein KDJ22_11395 [Candidatus Competibacteraceae bacterium]|nr:hypothetical protein [Candidatus Competibacteraceae bacterium]MCP5451512.1 hypothetical protein [Gammaproteobacteria bacterium]HRX63230.1 hypothetical protein [Candidatus Competibacter sp.]
MPISPVTPEKTCAVVVGIEQYAIGARWNLDGPASDAARFVGWLCSKGVPPGNILVLLSPLEDNRKIGDGLTQRGIRTQVASHDHIVDTLANGLPCLDGELLWLFWGGHGVITSDHQRRLFCANATANNQQIIGLEDLLAMLRSKTCGRFKHQIGVIDACANYFEEMHSKVSLAESSFSRREPAGDVRQFVLYGAATGELARNDTIRKTGAFSEVVLETLERDLCWPPDIDGLYKKVKNHFNCPNRDVKARQTPVYFQWQWPDEGEGIVGDLPVSGQMQTAVGELGLAAPQLRKLAKAVLDCPSLADNKQWEALHKKLPPSLKALFPREAEAADGETALIHFFVSVWKDREGIEEWLAALQRVEKDRRAFRAVEDKIDYLRQVNEVRRRLGEIMIMTAELRQLYRHSAPDPQLAPEADDLDQVLENLWDMTSRTDRGISPLLEFVERVARRYNRPNLSDWVKNAASPQQVADLKGYLKQEEVNAAAVREYLLIDLPSATSPMEYWFHSWNRERDSHDSIEPVASEELVPAALADILDNLDSIRQGELVIELFVPFDMLCCEVDRWEIEYSGGIKATLGGLHPFVLRWRDRALNKPRTRAGAWREVTCKIRARESAGIPLKIRWIDPHQKTQQVMNRIGSGDYGECIGFSFIPVDRGASPVHDLLAAALLGGAPFAFWTREAPRNWQDFEQAMNNELLLAGKLDDVPCQIKNVRSRGDAPSHPGYALTLFWDDPDRNPLVGQYSATTPQRGAP